MSTHVNTETGLPVPAAALINGVDLASKVGQTISVISVDLQGWPHYAMLSVGGVLSTSATDIRLVLHAGSGTTAALTGTARALLHLVLDSTSYRIRVGVRRISLNVGPFAFFVGGIVRVDGDWVAYAELTSGISFRPADQDAVVERRCGQIGQLRAAE